MTRALVLALTLLMSQTPGSGSQPAATAPRFDGARAWEHLRQQVALGPRPSGSPALLACRRYLASTLRSYGLDVREQAFEASTPIGLVPMANVIAAIPGRRAERIVIATHYDTKRFDDIRFIGASDGASSTAAVLELGRVLSTGSQEFTIELLFLDGEEAVVEWRGTDHTYGSRHYVDAARLANTLPGIKAVVLLDMIGDRDLGIRRDSNSTAWLTDLIWETARALGHRQVFRDDFTTIDDDHIPFLLAGVPAVDIIDLDYEAWHTAADDLDHVSARSLQVVGDVVVAALPAIEARLASLPRRAGF